MRNKIIALASALALTTGLAAAQIAGGTPSPDGARVYFVNLQDGAHVTNPVLVQFGLSGMGVAPFGLTGAGTENTGHHHLVIDADTPQAGVPIPAEPMHYIHYGRGQTEVSLQLPPGEHTLQLVLGDAGHIPHNPMVVSDRITITVDR